MANTWNFRPIRRLCSRHLHLVLFAFGLLAWIYYNWSYSVKLVEHKDDEDFFLKYRPPNQSGVAEVGRRMEVDKKFLRWRKDLDYVTVTTEIAKEFVVVTAASFSFYENSLEAISTVQDFFPAQRIFFYDLGGSSSTEKVVAERFNSLCGVTHRSFNFQLYPAHVRSLKLYAWKPLIIYELLREFPGVLWIDSSIRFISNNWTYVSRELIRNDGMLTLTSTGHSNFAVTHRQMYAFIPTSKFSMIKTDQHEANSVILFRTQAAVDNVVWWWFLCALDPLCIAPTDRVNCNDPYRSPNVYASCHRFDQSALNILLANYFAFDHMRYISSTRTLEVHRIPDMNRNVLVCAPGRNRIPVKTSMHMSRNVLEHEFPHQQPT